MGEAWGLHLGDTLSKGSGFFPSEFWVLETYFFLHCGLIYLKENTFKKKCNQDMLLKWKVFHNEDLVMVAAIHTQNVLKCNINFKI